VEPSARSRDLPARDQTREDNIDVSSLFFFHPLPPPDNATIAPWARFFSFSLDAGISRLVHVTVSISDNDAAESRLHWISGQMRERERG